MGKSAALYDACLRLSQGTLRTASVQAKTVAAISTLIFKTLRLETSAETVDVDDEDLEDEKEKNADLHGVPDEDDDGDYVDDGWV